MKEEDLGKLYPRRRRLEDVEGEAVLEDDVDKLHLLRQEYVMERKRQRMEKEPMREAASSSTDGAKYAEETGMDIDQIVTEVWGEGRNNKCIERDRTHDESVERERKLKYPWGATGKTGNLWSTIGQNEKSLERGRTREKPMERDRGN